MFMDKMHISKSILSITSPGTYLVPDNGQLNVKITRETNDELSGICRLYPDRFRFFASLPLPEVEASIAEVDRALNELEAIGFAILSNGAGVYPGDKRLERVWDKLNERKATVLLHPTSCHHGARGSDGRDHRQSGGSSSAPSMTEYRPMPKYPNPMLEFPFETTRAVVDLILSGTLRHCSSVTLIIPHAGAVIPPLISRVSAFSSFMAAARDPSACVTGTSVAEVKSILANQCYFDLAGIPFPARFVGC